MLAHVSVKDQIHSILVQFPERHDDQKSGSSNRCRLHHGDTTIGRNSALNPRPRSGYYQMRPLLPEQMLT